MTRNFAGGPTPQEIHTLCAESLRAPSAGFSQGSHLLVMVGEHLDEFWSRSGAGAWFADRSPGVLRASAVVLVCGDRRAYLHRYSEADKAGLGLDRAEAWPVPYWLTDAAMVAENLLLLVEERRWGALFFGLSTEQASILHDLRVPAAVECIGAVAIGYRDPADVVTGSPTRRKREPVAERLHLGRWGADVAAEPPI